MSAFLLPLHYLTFKVGKVLSVVMLLSYFLPIVLRIGSYERSALASLGKFFLRKIEYSSVKARQKLIARCSQLFFYLQHPIIETPARLMHYISCTTDSLLLMTTISTLPERYRSCKCEPFQSEFHNGIP